MAIKTVKACRVSSRPAAVASLIALTKVTKTVLDDGTLYWTLLNDSSQDTRLGRRRRQVLAVDEGVSALEPDVCWVGMDGLLETRLVVEDVGCAAEIRVNV